MGKGKKGALRPNLSGPDSRVHVYHPEIFVNLHPHKKSQNMICKKGGFFRPIPPYW